MAENSCASSCSSKNGSVSSLSKNDLVRLTTHVESISQLSLKQKGYLAEEAKVLCVDWSDDSQVLAASTQGGQISVWDVALKERIHCITTPNLWVFTVSFSPSQNVVAAGGLDTKCNVYKIPRGKNMLADVHPVAQHQSYVLCSSFKSDHQILTGSSDTTSALWDVESATLIRSFHGHSADVSSLDFKDAPGGSVFVTGSADRNIGVWDMRTGTCVQSFFTHEDEINQVKCMPGEDAVASVSDDTTCRLYDLRMDKELAVYERDSILFAACSLDFSLSGRILFVGYGDHSIHMWDTLKATHLGSLHGHENKVNCLKLSPDGSYLVSGSWDQSIKIWM